MDISDEELTLIIEALEEAAFFRDARSNVVKSAVRRHARRSGLAEPQIDDVHRDRARAYQALATRLKRKP